MCRRPLAVLFLGLITTPFIFAEEPIFPNNSGPARYLGGLMIIRQGDQTTVSVGGTVLPRKIKVTTDTPEGPVVTRFRYPSAFHTPNALPLPESAPAWVNVSLPEPNGIVYLDGELISGEGRARVFQSPPLIPGREFPLHVRAAFKVGDEIWIEEKTVSMRAGERMEIGFDGAGAFARVKLDPR